jgi:hypothetical protein
VPVIKLRDDCPVSDEFRAKFNRWLVEEFGTRDESIIPLGMAIMFGSNMAMRPQDAVLIRNIGV